MVDDDDDCDIDFGDDDDEVVDDDHDDCKVDCTRIDSSCFSLFFYFGVACQTGRVTK